MEMRRCERGHYYDASIHGSCPYCKNVSDTDKTVAMGVGGMMEAPSAPAAGAVENEAPNVTRPLFEAVQSAGDDDGRTVALIQSDMGIDPVVGWLVCVSGKEKGRSYMIHSDNNYIGRSEKMDICIRGDETISRENQAVITYDTNDNCYYFSSGDGRSIVRVNNKAIFQTMTLQAYDRLMIGKTELLFMPLCGEQFKWEDETENS
ncbi:MAG: FHA domain-containing protein [Roseburia sp.]|nr:FHA domain-containing protein [Ruminococcus sp.]MCM1155999.1 FHA domain-containing protein [Roseburia sp.]MCM1242793.1 FHA domain-containing protein [Roseburia sp.]